jgi:lipoate-protein ligase A
MAADTGLLEWVSRGPARLAFRTYGWDRPTLSLGRREPFPDGWDEEALAREGIAVVRRPTGGNAVLHAEEVTFALAASIPGPWSLTPRAFATAAAEALSRALRGCGVPGSRVSGDASDSGPDGRAMTAAETVCFARIAPGEVEASGYKVAGLASRFGRGGALCHASVPLTARSRSVAAFRIAAAAEAIALERHARSLGELLRLDLDAAGDAATRRLAATIAGGLAEEIAARFGAVLLDASFAALGIEEETGIAEDPPERAKVPARRVEDPDIGRVAPRKPAAVP